MVFVWLDDEKDANAGLDAQIVRDAVNQCRPCCLYAQLEISLPLSWSLLLAAYTLR
jgi:hypothetical protein